MDTESCWMPNIASPIHFPERGYYYHYARGYKLLLRNSIFSTRHIAIFINFPNARCYSVIVLPLIIINDVCCMYKCVV